MFRGDFDEAQKLYQEAFQIRHAAQQKIPAAESQLDLAALSFERGDSSSPVENKVREVIGIFKEEKAINDETAATALLARILLARGQLREALALAERAILVSSKADPNFRLAASTTAEPIRVAAGRSSVTQAVANLEKTISEARKVGYAETALEAMLAVGELEMKSGAVSRGRMHLQAVQQEAHRRGLMILAGRAASSRS